MTFIKNLKNLWKGEVPLERAFWSYAVFGGIVVNALTTAAFLILLVQEQPVAAAIIGYGLSLPYNGLVSVAVWRAAGRQGIDPGKTKLYRSITLIGMLAVSLS